MYCKYCGKELAEEEVCTCTATAPDRSAALREAAYRAAYTVTHALKCMAVDFRQMFTGSAEEGISAPAGVGFLISGLVAHVVVWICIVARFLSGLKKTAVLFWGTAAIERIDGLFRGVYASAVGGGFVTFLVPLVIAVLIPLIARLLRKEQVDFRSCALTGIGATVLPSGLLLLAGLVTLAIPGVGALLVGVAAMTGLVMFYRQLAKEIRGSDTAGSAVLIAVLLIAIAALVAWAVSGVITGYLKGTFAVNLNDAVSVAEFLKYLLSSLF